MACDGVPLPPKGCMVKRTLTVCPAAPSWWTMAVSVNFSSFFITGGAARSTAMSVAESGPTPTVKTPTPSRRAASTAEGPAFWLKSLIITTPARLLVGFRRARSSRAAPRAVVWPLVVIRPAMYCGSTRSSPSANVSITWTPSGRSTRNVRKRNFSASRASRLPSFLVKRALTYSARVGPSSGRPGKPGVSVGEVRSANPTAPASLVRSVCDILSCTFMLSVPSSTIQSDGRGRFDVCKSKTGLARINSSRQKHNPRSEPSTTRTVPLRVRW